MSELYLVVVYDCITPQLIGPYPNEYERLKVAQRINSQGAQDGVFKLDIAGGTTGTSVYTPSLTVYNDNELYVTPPSPVRKKTERRGKYGTRNTGR